MQTEAVEKICSSHTLLALFSISFSSQNLKFCGGKEREKMSKQKLSKYCMNAMEIQWSQGTINSNLHFAY